MVTKIRLDAFKITETFLKPLKTHETHVKFPLKLPETPGNHLKCQIHETTALKPLETLKVLGTLSKLPGLPQNLEIL